MPLVGLVQVNRDLDSQPLRQSSVPPRQPIPANARQAQEWLTKELVNSTSHCPSRSSQCPKASLEQVVRRHTPKPTIGAASADQLPTPLRRRPSQKTDNQAASDIDHQRSVGTGPMIFAASTAHEITVVGSDYCPGIW